MPRHLLVTNDYPPKTGGIQVYLHELWRRLEPGRAVVVTATSAPDPEAFDATSEIAIERIGAKTLFFPTRSAKRAIEISSFWTRPGHSVSWVRDCRFPMASSCTVPR
jgi:phosphatidylinositol alpha-1,6-mannosyltransferase